MPPGFGEARVCQVFLASDISTSEAPPRTSERTPGEVTLHWSSIDEPHPTSIVRRSGGDEA